MTPDQYSINKNATNNRLDWIDQVKGLTIFLVVYGHNFPFTEKYIYTFHMPLFIMIAGFFHPQKSTFENVLKRFKTIIIPYFIWSLSLFTIWFFVLRSRGDSATLNLSPIKNFIGVFYSQGGSDFMDWGIPLWFLPAIFCTYFLLHLIKKIERKSMQIAFLILVPFLGFLYSRYFSVNLPWSINIAMVALLFYGFGNLFFEKILTISNKKGALIMICMFLINALLYHYNIKIDMYRAIYGNEIFFVLSGLSGSLFILFFFKLLPIFRFLQFIGKFSLTILAAQLIAMSFIKFVLLILFHQEHFDFSEWEKFLYAILQIVLMIPGFYIINKYIPILNGGYKKI